MIHIHCFHGFLGNSKDWDFLNSLESSNVKLLKHDLYSLLNDDQSMVNIELDAKYLDADYNMMLAYSMGGRLGTHIFDKELKMKEALFLSTGLGLLSEKEFQERKVFDSYWANKFLNDDWSTLIEDWNALDVLRGSKIARSESDYNRESLSKCFSVWGLAKQKNMREKINQWKRPVHWWVGSEDHKYIALSKSLNLKNIKIIENSGHRIIVDAQNEIRNFLTKRVEEILQCN